MTKIKHHFFVFICLFFTQLSVAQKQDAKKIEFNYIQNPLVKVNDDWSYSAVVIQKNKQEIQEKREAYTAKVDKANKEYQDAMEAYEGYTAAQKLVSKEPQKKIITPYFIGADFDEESLANQYINIDGFTKDAADGNFTIEVTIEGFDLVSTEKKSNKENTKHFYEVKYRNSISAKVIDSDGKEYYNELLDAEIKTFTTDQNESASELEKYWRENKISILTSLEESSTREQLQMANEEINNIIGYPEKQKEIKLYSAKDKKQNYSNLDEALATAEYALIGFKDDTQSSRDQLMEAITIWEQDVEQKDLDDKKARINKVVASALYIDLLYGYTLVGSYDKALDCLKQLKIIDLLRFSDDISEGEKFMKNFVERNPNIN